MPGFSVYVTMLTKPQFTSSTFIQYMNKRVLIRFFYLYLLPLQLYLFLPH